MKHARAMLNALIDSRPGLPLGARSARASPNEILQARCAPYVLPPSSNRRGRESAQSAQPKLYARVRARRLLTLAARVGFCSLCLLGLLSQCSLFVCCSWCGSSACDAPCCTRFPFHASQVSRARKTPQKTPSPHPWDKNRFLQLPVCRRGFRAPLGFHT